MSPEEVAAYRQSQSQGLPINAPSPDRRPTVRKFILGAVGLVLVGILVLFAFAAGGLWLLSSSWSVHTKHADISPDGQWSLIVDSNDEGALGGTSYVFLQRKSGGTQINLRPDSVDWLSDSDVGWLDARTVSILGEPSMPFVEHAIDTGSSRTSGTRTDSFGRVDNQVAPGERVYMLSGLSLVLPDAAAGDLLTSLRQRNVGAIESWQHLRSSSDRSRLLIAAFMPAEGPYWKTLADGRLVAGTRNGEIEIRWSPARRSLTVITRLPSHLTGLIRESDVELAGRAAARREAARLWRGLQVRGAQLPSA